MRIVCRFCRAPNVSLAVIGWDRVADKPIEVGCCYREACMAKLDRMREEHKEDMRRLNAAK